VFEPVSPNLSIQISRPRTSNRKSIYVLNEGYGRNRVGGPGWWRIETLLR
jgi:hypothetical protein